MPQRVGPRNWKQREERRRVIVPARVRAGSRWDDICILNISSRGLLIHATEDLSRGAYVELHRGPYVIVARVIWRDGTHAGLRAQDQLAIEQILSPTKAPARQLRVPRESKTDRRSRTRDHERSREIGRALEFASFAVIGLLASTAALALIAEALTEPLAHVRAALGS